MTRAGYSHSKGHEEVRGFRVRTTSERRWAIVREYMLCEVGLPSSWQLGLLVSLSRTFDYVVEAAAVADAKLSVDVAHMVLGGAFCDGEFVADVLNGASANEQLEHFGFSCGKPGPINHNIALCFDGKRQREGSCAWNAIVLANAGCGRRFANTRSGAGGAFPRGGRVACVAGFVNLHKVGF